MKEPLTIQKPLTMAESVYQKLRDHIVFGHLQPGERLAEKQLAAQMGVSRTPVREAIFRLEREGLIQVLPRQGAMVRRLSLEEARQVYEVRALLEGLAAQLAARNRPADTLAELRQVLDASRQVMAAQDTRELIRHNNRFHDLIVEMAGNQVLHTILSQLRSQVNLLRITLWSVFPGRSEQTLAEHESIYAALAAGDEEGAQAAAQAHIANSWAVLHKALVEHQVRQENGASA